MRGDVIAACMAVAVIAFLFAVMLGFVDGSERYDVEMKYEDWTPIEGEVLGTEGPIEIRNGMIHAVGVGKATATKADGSTIKIRISAAHADLILMNGQSNAAYYGFGDYPTAYDKTIAPVPALGTCFYFGYTDRMPYHETQNVSSCKIYDMVNADTGKLRVADKGPGFCKEYSEATSNKTIWVSLAIPSKRIAAWDQPSGSAWVQNIACMDKFNSLLQNTGFIIDKTIVLWAQGESDYLHDTGYAHYLTSFRTLHDSAPAAWGHDIAGWYLLEGRTAKVGWVNSAFEELAETMPDVHLATTSSLVDSFTLANGLLNTDELHYTQRGDNALADAAARSAAGVQGIAPIYLIQATLTAEQGSDPEAPTMAECYRTDGSRILATATWDMGISTAEVGTHIIGGTADGITEGMTVQYTAADPVLIVTVTAAEDEP